MDPAKLFELVNQLIVAVAQLLWPLALIVALLLFRRDVSALLVRLRKGKLLGQELELDPAVDALKDSTEKASREIQAPPTLGLPEDAAESRSDDPDGVLRDAARNPEVALMSLSRLLERELRQLAASMGYLTPGRTVTAPHLIEILADKRFLPVHAVDSIRRFWNLRSRVVHGRPVEDDRSVLRVLDIGLDLLRLIRLVPHEVNVVSKVDVPLFTDPDCTQPIGDARGLILDTTAPHGQPKKKRIFPTTRRGYYEKGRRVSWEWNLEHAWGPTWYVNPETGLAEQAWSSSGEFLGRHIEEV